MAPEMKGWLGAGMANGTADSIDEKLLLGEPRTSQIARQEAASFMLGKYTMKDEFGDRERVERLLDSARKRVKQCEAELRIFEKECSVDAEPLFPDGILLNLKPIAQKNSNISE